ncbi:hypothetical protein QTN25_003825 [Entamoeba marina]
MSSLYSELNEYPTTNEIVYKRKTIFSEMQHIIKTKSIKQQSIRSESECCDICKNPFGLTKFLFGKYFCYFCRSSLCSSCLMNLQISATIKIGCCKECYQFAFHYLQILTKSTVISDIFQEITQLKKQILSKYIETGEFHQELFGCEFGDIPLTDTFKRNANAACLQLLQQCKDYRSYGGCGTIPDTRIQSNMEVYHVSFKDQILSYETEANFLLKRLQQFNERPNLFPAPDVVERPSKIGIKIETKDKGLHGSLSLLNKCSLLENPYQIDPNICATNNQVILHHESIKTSTSVWIWNKSMEIEKIERGCVVFTVSSGLGWVDISLKKKSKLVVLKNALYVKYSE